jgi:heme exporter protein C
MMNRAIPWLGAAAVLGMLATVGLSLVSPTIFYPIGNQVQACQACRIIYVHVPSAWLAYLAFCVVCVASVAYLRTEVRRWDTLARASAEVGVVFTTLTLITGSLWGRPVWGTWWSWDARLTTTLILWFIYLAYLMLRAYVANERHAPRYAAVLGIVGFVAVPINYFSVTLWRTLHPDVAIVRVEGPAMPAYMLQTLAVALVAFTLVYVYLLLQRIRADRLRDEVAALRYQTERLREEVAARPLARTGA